MDDRTISLTSEVNGRLILYQQEGSKILPHYPVRGGSFEGAMLGFDHENPTPEIAFHFVNRESLYRFTGFEWKFVEDRQDDLRNVSSSNREVQVQ